MFCCAIFLFVHVRFWRANLVQAKGEATFHYATIDLLNCLMYIFNAIRMKTMKSITIPLLSSASLLAGCSAKYVDTYADLQNAFAGVYAAIGIDPYGEGISVTENAKDLSATLRSTWVERGDRSGI